MSRGKGKKSIEIAVGRIVVLDVGVGLISAPASRGEGVLITPVLAALLLDGLVPRGVEVVGEVGGVIVARFVHACIIPDSAGDVKRLGKDISKKL